MGKRILHEEKTVRDYHNLVFEMRLAGREFYFR